jgi:hypothetical protein
LSRASIALSTRLVRAALARSFRSVLTGERR